MTLLSAATAAAAIQVEQRLLRARTERLLEDIRNLELRRSTWADAQRIYTRWGAWGHYDGSCVASNCNYRVTFVDIFAAHSASIPDTSTIRRVLDLFGVRMTLVAAQVVVSDSLVMGKGFMMGVDVPPDDRPNHPFSGYRYSLIGRAETVSDTFRLGGSLRERSLHPEYAVTSPSACTGCIASFVRFTPLANPADVQRLMDFNLACMTSYKPCREQEDIMPSAWRQHLAEMQKERTAVDTPTP